MFDLSDHPPSASADAYELPNPTPVATAQREQPERKPMVLPAFFQSHEENLHARSPKSSRSPLHARRWVTRTALPI